MAKSLPPDYETYRPVVQRSGSDGGPKKALVDRSLVETVLGHTETENVEPDAPAAPEEAVEVKPTSVVQFPKAEDRKKAGEGGVAKKPAAKVAEPKAPKAGASEPSPGPAQIYERMTEALRFKVTESERQEVAERINRHAGALRTRLTLSHLMRVWVNILREADPYILKALEGATLKRPGNEDALAVAEFEEQLTGLYLGAVEKMAKRRKAEAQGGQNG